jgi:hypothetical protein
MGYPNRMGRRYPPGMKVFPHLMSYRMPAERNGRWDMTWGAFTPLYSTTNSWSGQSPLNQPGTKPGVVFRLLTAPEAGHG